MSSSDPSLSCHSNGLSRSSRRRYFHATRVSQTFVSQSNSYFVLQTLTRFAIHTSRVYTQKSHTNWLKFQRPCGGRQDGVNILGPSVNSHLLGLEILSFFARFAGHKFPQPKPTWPRQVRKVAAAHARILSVECSSESNGIVPHPEIQ